MLYMSRLSLCPKLHPNFNQVLSKRVGAERIPEVFWEYFAVAVQRTIAKVAKDDD